jgi:hypothetical protein
MHTLPNTQLPRCGAQLRVVSRHAMFPFPFRGLSQFITGTGNPGGQKLCQ